MWNASAISASEPTMKPLMSSTRKKTMSMASMMLMRVDLESAILDGVRAAARACWWVSESVGQSVGQSAGLSIEPT